MASFGKVKVAVKRVPIADDVLSAMVLAVMPGYEAYVSPPASYSCTGCPTLGNVALWPGRMEVGEPTLAPLSDTANDEKYASE
jgi:hypothetical protein